MDLLNRLVMLAQQPDEDRGWARFIFGALVILFWVISAAASAIGKNKEKQRRERVRRTVGRAEPAPHGPQRPPAYRTQTPPQPARVPPAAPPRQRVPERPPQRSPQRPPQRTPQRGAPSQRSAPSRFAGAVAIASAAPTLDTTKPIEATEIRSTDAPASRPPPLSANAAALARWLNPLTLRHQYILTEILQPPVGMREPRE